MKKSFKKLSMMVMLGFILNPISTETNHNSQVPAVIKPTSAKIKVINLPQDQLIAAKVKNGNSVQTPVHGKYTLYSDHTYYAITRDPANGKYSGIDRITPNTEQAGQNFKGKTTWDIATNTIS